jgi:hypothetical protein
VTLGALDDHVDDLPHEGAMLIVCSSYNGTPPDNAGGFCRWIAGAGGGAGGGVAYTVFGCGNTEWVATYQAVPTLLDDQLAAHGGRRIRARGEGNAAGDFDAAYRDWHAGLWRDVAESLGLAADVAAAAPAGPRLSITFTNRQLTNPVIMSYRARPTRVRVNRELIPSENGQPPERSTRHVEIALPADMSYLAGDHLGVLPRNGIDLIRRVWPASAWTRGSTSRSSPPVAATPTCRSTSRRRSWASWAAVSSYRTSRLATTSPRSPATPTTPSKEPRCKRSAATTTVPGTATETRCSPPTGRCSICSRRSPRALCRSRSTSTCCRRYARGITDESQIRLDAGGAMGETAGRGAAIDELKCRPLGQSGLPRCLPLRRP